METVNRGNQTKVALHYGVMSGLTSILVFVLIYFSGNSPLGQSSWLGVWVPVVFIPLAIKFHRNKNLEGYITFGQGFFTGIKTTFFAALLFSLLVYLFGAVIDGNLLESYKEEAMVGMEEVRPYFSENMIDAALENLDKMTMSSVAFNEFLTKMLGGAIISLIAAAAYRKKADLI